MVDLRRFGFHAQPTLFVLTFSGPLDPAQARNTSNYDLRYAGPGRLSGTRIAIASATYDPIMHTVTLAPYVLLPLRRPYELTVTGLGINYQGTFGDEIVAGPFTVRSRPSSAWVDAGGDGAKPRVSRLECRDPTSLLLEHPPRPLTRAAHWGVFLGPEGQGKMGRGP